MMKKPKLIPLKPKQDEALNALKTVLQEVEQTGVQGIVIGLILENGAQDWHVGGLSTYEAIGLLHSVAVDILNETLEPEE